MIMRTGDREERVRVDRVGSVFVVTVGGLTYEVDEAPLVGGRTSLLFGGEQFEVSVAADGAGRYEVGTRHGRRTVEVYDPLAWLAEQGAHGRDRRRVSRVTAYMPGRVVAVLVEEGERVASGQGLVVLEAMKMENEIVAENDGVVEKVAVVEGQAVEGGDLLFELGGAGANDG